MNGCKWGPLGSSEASAPAGAPSQEVVLDKNGHFTGDIHGDLHLHGDYLHVIIEGNVEGNVEAQGNVACRSVGGSVQANGNVSSRSVGGGVLAGG